MIRPLVLASGSPRRRELLSGLALAFTVAAAMVDERRMEGEAPATLVRRLSRAKADAVAPHYPDAIIIGADTVVVLDGDVLGKPADWEEAVRMLRALRDRSHDVHSAVTVLDSAAMRAVSEVSASRVWMRDYGDREIADYVASGDPLDKAGAYAIQHRDFAPVVRIEGCYTGVMGLPLGHLARALERVQLTVPVDVAMACEHTTGAACCLSGGPDSTGRSVARPSE